MRMIFSSIVVQINVVSNIIRESNSAIQTIMKRSKKNKNKKIFFMTNGIAIGFKSVKFQFVEFNKNGECERVINVIKVKSVFILFFLKLNIVFRVLQEINHLV
jgi:sulfur relay (sulfurtransferase) complex TusBCD TusD component (DsrE family)